MDADYAGCGFIAGWGCVVSHWHPVYKSGCGWDECPECGPLIELEKVRMHEAARDRTFPKFREDWSNAQDRGSNPLNPTDSKVKAARKRARESRAAAREVIRVRRPLTPQQYAEAQRYILKCKIKREFLVDGQPHEWRSRVWIELVNPTIAATRQKCGTWKIKPEKAFKVRLLRAIYRAQRAMRAATAEKLLEFSTDTSWGV